MREIKFRAWRTKDKQMDFSDSWRTLWEFLEFHERTYSEAYELMQFTGLLDRNGKEIYEGDIITIGNSMRNIRYDRGSFTMFNGESRRLPLSDHSSEKYEVIGNIYENADLLKEAE